MDVVKVRYPDGHVIDMPGSVEVVAKILVKNRKGAKYRLYTDGMPFAWSGYIVVPGMEGSIGLSLC